jgi:hypothetical protein
MPHVDLGWGIGRFGMLVIRLVHAIVAWAFVASIVIQVFLAGAAIANLGGSGDFKTHIEFGYTAVGLVALAVLLTAVAARVPRRDVATSFGLLLLYVIQTSLPSAKANYPAVAALHPVNALLLFALATWYARHAWRERAASAASAPSETDAATATAH